MGSGGDGGSPFGLKIQKALASWMTAPMPAALVVLKLRSIRGVDFSHGQTSEDRRLTNYPPSLSPAAAGLGGGCMLGCSSSPQDGSVVSGATKNNHAPHRAARDDCPHPLILAGPITAHVMADDPDGTEPTKRFQWIVNGTPVLGATGPELDPVHAKRGDQVALEVVAADGESESVPYRTAPVLW